MSVISLFSASHCHGGEIARGVRDGLGYPLLGDDELLAESSKRFTVPVDVLGQAIYGPISVFNRLTHKKERHVACVRATLADLMQRDELVYHGFAAHLLPRNLPHVLRVCLAATTDYRIDEASRAEGTSEQAAKKRVSQEDEKRKRWTLYLFGLSPWDKGLYDIFLPMDSTSVDEAVAMIVEHAKRPPVRTTPASQEAMKDFLLSAQVQLALAQKGHDVDLDVSCHGGVVTVTINRYAFRLEHLKKELHDVVLAVPGAKDLKTVLGQHYRPRDRYDQMVEESMPKILLVDDEKQFVLTLSERLETRNFTSAIAYDGEEALAILQVDAPDVMVLDLRMPGVDGMEVLRRVKRETPAVEVIILTGHGSEQEERQALELGAFAYLEKPVNIDLLAETMRLAHDKAKKGNGDPA